MIRLQGLGQCNGSLVAYLVAVEVLGLKRRIGLVSVSCPLRGVATIWRMFADVRAS